MDKLNIKTMLKGFNDLTFEDQTDFLKAINRDNLIKNEIEFVNVFVFEFTHNEDLFDDKKISEMINNTNNQQDLILEISIFGDGKWYKPPRKEINEIPIHCNSVIFNVQDLLALRFSEYSTFSLGLENAVYPKFQGDNLWKVTHKKINGLIVVYLNYNYI